VRLLLVAAPLAGSGLAEALFPGVPATVVAPETLRVTEPWRGELFDLIEVAAGASDTAALALTAAPAPAVGTAPAAGDAAPAPAAAPGVIGLLVPVVWVAPAPAPELAIVADHVNTRLRGPRPGRRPVGGPRTRGPQPVPSRAGV